MNKVDVKRLLRKIAVLVFLVVCAITYSGKMAQSASHARDESDAQKEKLLQQRKILSHHIAQKRKNFTAGRELLRQANVPFDPDELNVPNWRKNLAGHFTRMPEMQAVRMERRPLAGVYMADTLYLPENVDLAGDTVILAKHLIFEGSNVFIKGNHAFHVFPVESSGVMGTTIQAYLMKENHEAFTKVNFTGKATANMLPTTRPPVQPGNIDIDTSGASGSTGAIKKSSSAVSGVSQFRVASWTKSVRQQLNTSGAPGSDGSDGAPGANGGNGSNGSNGGPGQCGGAINGQSGNPGNAGTTGGNGGNGGNGLNGGNATPNSWDITDNGNYAFHADGGRGGNGGSGGLGGRGGIGGDGGNGGDGAGCACAAGQLGSGGNGGNGAQGGKGGDGGRGGNAGNGGDGADVTITTPANYTGSATATADAGAAGTAGSPGNPGSGGSGGHFGTAGQGGTFSFCSLHGNNGQDGTGGTDGPGGAGGIGGNGGSGGSPGNVSIVPTQDGNQPCPDICDDPEWEPTDYCTFPETGCKMGTADDHNGCCERG